MNNIGEMSSLAITNKKVFNINDESISFDDLQRLSNCIVDLNDEVTSLEAMSN